MIRKRYLKGSKSLENLIRCLKKRPKRQEERNERLVKALEEIRDSLVR